MASVSSPAGGAAGLTLGALVGQGNHTEAISLAIDQICGRSVDVGAGREGLVVEGYAVLVRRCLGSGEGLEEALVGEHGVPRDQAKRAADVLARRSGDIRYRPSSSSFRPPLFR